MFCSLLWLRTPIYGRVDNSRLVQSPAWAYILYGFELVLLIFSICNGVKSWTPVLTLWNLGKDQVSSSAHINCKFFASVWLTLTLTVPMVLLRIKLPKLLNFRYVGLCPTKSQNRIYNVCVTISIVTKYDITLYKVITSTRSYNNINIINIISF